MFCPWCEKEARKTRVLETNVNSKYTLRKRFCTNCGSSFNSHEVAARTPPQIAWWFSERMAITLLSEKGYNDIEIGKLMARPYTMIRTVREEMLDSGSYFEMLNIIEQEKD